jgi:monoamine oxidase
MNFHQRKPKTQLLASLLKALQKAMRAREDKIPANEASEFYSEQRRDFLKKTGKATAAVTLLGLMESCQKTIHSLSPYNLEEPMSTNKNITAPRISIIGAGIAGLHAAYILKQKGFNATLYEGSSRTGGRMYTAKNIMGAGLTTELGGEFIDSGHKDMLNLASNFNLALLDTQASSETSLNYQAYYFNGIHYSEQEVINEFSYYADAIKKDIQSLSVIIDADHYNANDQLFDNLSISAYFDRIGLHGWLRNLLDVAYVTEYGLSTDQQTSLNFLFLISPKINNGRFEIFGVSDERYKINGGNQQICDQLALQLSGQINTEHELVSIKQNSNNSYDLIFKASNKTITVTTDILLITIPFTLLRNVSIQPGWPQWKRDAIFNIGYGNNSKLMLGFKKRYWRDLGYAGYYFTDSFLQSGWDNSELQAPVTGGLTIYSGGDQALKVGTGSVNSQVNTHMPLLEKMYPGAAANYSNKAERFIWPTYKWTKCSYTCFHPGQYTTIAGNEIKPVGKIFFAGEHCSYNFQGYMNGGAETGRRAAEEILKTL